VNLGLNLGLGAQLLGGGFSPLTLFSAGEQGYWLDPSDFSTMFQDAAGTTPVTAAGQSVRRILDKSGRGNHFTQANVANAPILGREPFGGRRNLLTFTEQFDNAAWVVSGLTRSANTSVAPDGSTTADTITGSSGINAVVFNTSPIALAAADHTVSCYIKAGTAAYVVLSVWAGSGTLGINQWFDLQSGVIGSNSVTAGYTRTSGNISSVGDGWYRVSVSGTTPAGNAHWSLRLVDTDNAFVYTNTVGDTALIWGAQLETGSTATAYQRVTTAFDVTQAGVPDCYYLQYDGSDDWLQSAATINPGAVDKAQLFAGVRKLSDAAVGVVLESSASLAANNGTIQLLAPSTAGAPTYGFTSRGTSNGAATYNNAAVTAPVTNVVSGLADISAPSSILRVNGSQVGSNTSSQGTGNYLTYTHFIGRRNGATIPFNGRLYQMITRFGANLTADQIAATETFVNQRTGAY
jgi:hypothetical protein